MQLLRKQIKLKILGWFYYGNLIVSCLLRPNLAEVPQTPGTMDAGMAVLFQGRHRLQIGRGSAFLRLALCKKSYGASPKIMV